MAHKHTQHTPFNLLNSKVIYGEAATELRRLYLSGCARGVCVGVHVGCNTVVVVVVLVIIAVLLGPRVVC